MYIWIPRLLQIIRMILLAGTMSLTAKQPGLGSIPAFFSNGGAKSSRKTAPGQGDGIVF
jgi:hypothetical protein